MLRDTPQLISALMLYCGDEDDGVLSEHEVELALHLLCSIVCCHHRGECVLGCAMRGIVHDGEHSGDRRCTCVDHDPLGYRRSIREIVRTNNDVPLLLQTLQTRAEGNLNYSLAVRTLTVVSLFGLSRDTETKKLLTAMDVPSMLSQYWHGVMLKGASRERVQLFRSCSLELINTFTGQGLRMPSSLQPLRQHNPQALMVAQTTKIDYSSSELLMLISQHLKSVGLEQSAALVMKEGRGKGKIDPIPLNEKQKAIKALSDLPTRRTYSFVRKPSKLLVPPPSMPSRSSDSASKTATIQFTPKISAKRQHKRQEEQQQQQRNNIQKRSQEPSISEVPPPFSISEVPTSKNCQKGSSSPKKTKHTMISPRKLSQSHSQLDQSEQKQTKRRVTDPVILNAASLSTVSTSIPNLTPPTSLTAELTSRPRKMSQSKLQNKQTNKRGKAKSVARKARRKRARSHPIDTDDQPPLKMMRRSSVDTPQTRLLPATPKGLSASKRHLQSVHRTPASSLQKKLQLRKPKHTYAPDLQENKVTLDSIVKSFLREQHLQCSHPVSTLPTQTLEHHHKCPPCQPLSQPSLVSNLESRSNGIGLFPGHFRPNGTERRFLYGAYSPMESLMSEHGNLYCSSFLGNRHLLCGGERGIHIFKLANGTEFQPWSIMDNIESLSIIDKGPQSLLCGHSNARDVCVYGGFEPFIQNGDIDGLSTLSPVLTIVQADSGKLSSDGKILATMADTASLHDLQSGSLKVKYDLPSGLTVGRPFLDFSPENSLLLAGGLLFDIRSPHFIKRFDQVTRSVCGGVFHPNSLDVLVGSAVWDLRTLSVRAVYPALDGARFKFDSRGDALYAFNHPSDVLGNSHRLSLLTSTFRTIDAHTYNVLSTTDCEKSVFDVAVDRHNDLMATIESDFEGSSGGYARVLQVGRRLSEEEESSDESEDDEDIDEEQEPYI
eukprot:TRINITY_DN184_c0_g2_i1.p1 TRINITY_DN184_c0_g2~~TRINITY_DN184_c0_g2_i1.p1  ORF type:complete len:1016 (-),score=312.76 TRINITY_DN184_c0_g2_i1:192-3023(-)